MDPKRSRSLFASVVVKVIGLAHEFVLSTALRHGKQMGVETGASLK